MMTPEELRALAKRCLDEDSDAETMAMRALKELGLLALHVAEMGAPAKAAAPRLDICAFEDCDQEPSGLCDGHNYSEELLRTRDERDAALARAEKSERECNDLVTSLNRCTLQRDEWKARYEACNIQKVESERDALRAELAAATEVSRGWVRVVEQLRAEVERLHDDARQAALTLQSLINEERYNSAASLVRQFIRALADSGERARLRRWATPARLDPEGTAERCPHHDAGFTCDECPHIERAARGLDAITSQWDEDTTTGSDREDFTTLLDEVVTLARKLRERDQRLGGDVSRYKGSLVDMHREKTERENALRAEGYTQAVKDIVAWLRDGGSWDNASHADAIEKRFGAKEKP